MLSKLIKLFKNTNTVQTPQPSNIKMPKSLTGGQGEIQVDDIFLIAGRGIVLSGKVLSGTIAIGFGASGGVRIKGIELFNQQKEFAEAGEMVGVLTNLTDKKVAKEFLKKYPSQIVLFSKPLA